MDEATSNPAIEPDAKPEQELNDEPVDTEAAPDDKPQSTVTPAEWNAMLTIVTNIIAYREEE